MKHIRTSYACLGLAVLMLPVIFSSCERDKPIPVPVDIFVPDEIKDFLYFEAGSQWIYQSDDGLHDTVTLIGIKIDTIHFVDKNGSLLSRQEYFFIDYFYTFLNQKVQIFRMEVSPSNPTINAMIEYEKFDLRLLLKSPSELNIAYYGGAILPQESMTIQSKTVTMIGGISKNAWIVRYGSWDAYDEQEIEITFVEDIGMYEMRHLGSNRVWSLVSSIVEKL